MSAEYLGYAMSTGSNRLEFLINLLMAWHYLLANLGSEINIHSGDLWLYYLLTSSSILKTVLMACLATTVVAVTKTSFRVEVVKDVVKFTLMLSFCSSFMLAEAVEVQVRSSTQLASVCKFHSYQSKNQARDHLTRQGRGK